MGIRKSSRIERVGDYLHVHSAQGHVALVDASDCDLVAGIAWQSQAKGRTIYFHHRYRDGSVVRSEFLHRRITDAPVGLLVDHIDHDGSNNTRANLRVVTSSENSANRSEPNKSGLLGAYYDGHSYYSRVCIAGIRHHLGSFPTAEAAHEAYMAARKA